MNKLSSLLRLSTVSDDGQGLAEYALILALVAIIVIVASSSWAPRSRRS
jgi:hypothetical protein